MAAGLVEPQDRAAIYERMASIAALLVATPIWGFALQPPRLANSVLLF